MPVSSTRRISLLVWLLCVIILSASLDRIADPPATKPVSPEVNAVTFNHAAGPVSPHSWSWARLGADVPFECCWLGACETTKSGYPNSCASIVRHAADPSPPNFNSVSA